MTIEKITIDGKRYHIVATDSLAECERCDLRRNGVNCDFICVNMSKIKKVFSVRFEEIVNNNQNKQQNA